MIQDVALVGIGIVGQIALEELSGSNLEIVVIDEINISSILRFHRDLDGNKSVWTPGSRVAGYPGGRLNWGKNCSFVTIENEPPLGEDIQKQLHDVSRRLRKYGFPRLSPVVLSKSKAGKFYVKESTDFSTQKWLSRIKTFRNILFVSGFATEIKQEQNGLIKILVRTSENSMQEIYAKKVLICCGPFGTQELLAKSGLLNSNPPQIRDHISYEVGDIQLSGVRLAKFGIFGWNRFRLINIKRCTTFFDERRNTMWTLRIFPESVLSLEMLIAKLKKAFAERKFVFCTSLIVKFTASFLTGKILIERIKVHISADFLDDSYPIKVASYGEGQRIDLLEYENDCIPISTEFRRFISRNVENLRLGVNSEVAMNLAEEIKFESINSSSHHMGTVWDVSKNSLASPLEISTDILVAGSSIFRASVPGHPTMLAAASAILAVDKIKSEID